VESETVSSGAAANWQSYRRKEVLIFAEARDAHLYSAITDCGAGGFHLLSGKWARKPARGWIWNMSAQIPRFKIP